MRWDALFADMELQLDAAAAQDRTNEVAELTRAERAAVRLVDRLHPGIGRPIRFTVRTGERLEGVLVEVGPEWALVRSPREHLVPLAALVTVDAVAEEVAPEQGPALRRLGLSHALRAVARDRSLVRVVTLAGTVHGRVDAVGADHMDVALAFEDNGRPTGRRLVVTFAGLDLVSSV